MRTILRFTYDAHRLERGPAIGRHRTTVTSTDIRAGLTSAEAADRAAWGLRNDVPGRAHPHGRGEIIKANVFTRFNFIVGSLFVVILVVGPLNDALFGGVVIAQHAHRDHPRGSSEAHPRPVGGRNAPHARGQRRQHRRDPDERGRARRCARAVSGDQVVVDGEVGESAALEVDESLLTGCPRRCPSLPVRP